MEQATMSCSEDALMRSSEMSDAALSTRVLEWLGARFCAQHRARDSLRDLVR